MLPEGFKYLLACYFDVSDVSFALVTNQTQEVKFFNFPYSYSDEAFSNQINEADFNKVVIETILKSNKIKLSEVEIITAGLMDPAKISLETAFSIRIPTLLQDIEGTYPIIVNDFSVLTKDSILSYELCSQKKLNLDGGESDEMANLSVYPQLIPIDIPTTTVLDREISEKIKSLNLEYSQRQHIVFSGSRFSRPVMFEYLDWMLAIDLVRKPGIHLLSLDRKNCVPLFSLIRKYKPEIILDTALYLEPLGTLVNSPGETECLLNSDLGTGQFFAVKKDSIYIVPVLKDSRESLAIKNRVIGNLEEFVVGGSVGLIVNTGAGKGSIFDNAKVLNDCVKQLSLCMHRS
jgi:hypothetical protein